ncbi:thioredoxin family protein [Fontibacillus sp. BL9]|uniref:thioredoxin family protein n=1 Tax=Fontibacillus sp. BL9 TaxID=3389971 RepID=UPI00397DB583
MGNEGEFTRKVNELTTINEKEAFLDNHDMSFIYVSTPDCSVCHALLPKLRELLADYPHISFGHVDASQVKEVAEKFLILEAPTMLFIIENKEYLREGRFVRFGFLKERLDRIYRIYDK